MKRPILVATIGYIIGIIVGLYFNISIVFLYIPIILIYYIKNKINYNMKDNIKNKTKKIKLITFKRYFRYVKLVINPAILLCIVILSIISNTIVICQNNKYEKIYQQFSEKNEVSLIGTVISNKIQNQYSSKYILQINNSKIKLYIRVDNKVELKYGDIIKIEGEYQEPEKQRNYKGFDYSKYLKQFKIYGTVKSKKVNILGENKKKSINKLFNNINLKIKDKVNKILPQDIASIVIGITLGDTEEINDEIYGNFKNASISHILAISGLHILYITIFLKVILEKIIGKRKSGSIIIIFLITYMCITNFSPSITRAGIMAIIPIIGNLIYRKNDMWNTFGGSLFIILIYNPFLILNIGLQLSYGATLGIILLNKDIEKYINNQIEKWQIKRNKKTRYNLKDKLKFKVAYKVKLIIKEKTKKIIKIISVSISVQMFILPIIISNSNIFNSYFLIANLLLSIVVSPIIICSFIFVVLILININFANFIKPLIQKLIEILILISKIGNLSNSKIYFSTPHIYTILIYYVAIIILKNIYKLYITKKKSQTQKRAKALIELAKYKFRIYKHKVQKVLIVLVIIVVLIKLIPKDFKIYFIDQTTPIMIQKLKV